MDKGWMEAWMEGCMERRKEDQGMMEALGRMERGEEGGKRCRGFGADGGVDGEEEGGPRDDGDPVGGWRG